MSRFAAALVSCVFLACAPVTSSTTTDQQTRVIRTLDDGCPPMSVPAIAASAVFADSTVFDKPELGTSYSYDSDALYIVTVFLYPSDPSGSPLEQADEFVTVMKTYLKRRMFESMEIVRNVPNGDGHEVRTRIRWDGENLESLFLVYPHGDIHVKFRVTHLPTPESREAVEEFVTSMRRAIAEVPAACRAQSIRA